MLKSKIDLLIAGLIILAPVQILISLVVSPRLAKSLTLPQEIYHAESSVPLFLPDSGTVAFNNGKTAEVPIKYELITGDSCEITGSKILSHKKQLITLHAFYKQFTGYRVIFPVKISVKASLDNWTQETAVTDMPEIREFASAAFHDCLWISGGEIKTKFGTHKTSRIIFSRDGVKWETACEVPGFLPRVLHTMISHKDSLYVIGGWNGTHYSDVWKSIDGIRWQQVTPSGGFPPRRGHCGISYNGRIWITGGYSGNSYLSDIWSSEDGANWKLETSEAQFGRLAGHAMCAFNNQVYLSGGDSDGVPTENIWTSDDCINWYSVDSSEKFPARYYHSMIAYNGKIVVCGGFNKSAFSDIWSSNNGSNWKKAEPESQFGQFYSGTCLELNNDLWIFGGFTGSGYRKEIWHTSDK